jgi:hypothetical protein
MIDATVSALLESDDRVQGVFENPSTATAEDITYIEELLKLHYPDTSSKIQVSPTDQVASLAQEKNEAIEAYYGRALMVLRQYGGRDMRVGITLTKLESNTLRMLIQAFIKGVHSVKLQDEASIRGALTTHSLQSAYKILDDAQHHLEIIGLREQETKNQEKIKAYDTWVRGRTPQQVAAMFSQSGTRVNSSYIQPSVQSVQSVQPVQPAVQPYTGYQNRPAQPSVRPLNASNTGYSQDARTGYAGGNRPQPDPTTSANPFVNGTTPFSRALGYLCTKCGTIGHRTDRCHSTHLSKWEQYVLRCKLRDSYNTESMHIEARTQAQQAVFQYRPNPSPPAHLNTPVQPIVQPQVQAQAQEQEYTLDELRAISQNHQVFGASVELFVRPTEPKKDRKKSKKISLQAYLGEGKRGRPEITEEELEREFYSSKIMRSDNYNPGTAEINITPEQEAHNLARLQAEILLNNPLSGPQQPATATATAPVLVKDFSRDIRPPQSNVRVEEPFREPQPPIQPTQYRSLYVEPEVELPPVRVAPMPVPTLIRRPTPSDPDPVVISKKKRATKQLKQIVGRMGELPVNYKDVMGNFTLTISLMDLLQISPDFAKNVRMLSTRANEKKKKRHINPESLAACITVNSNMATTGDYTDSTPIVSSSSASIHLAGYPKFVPVQSNDKAFRIPAKSKVTIDRRVILVNLKGLTYIADQGSDINIVTLNVVQTLNLPIYLVSPKKDYTLHMGTADGRSSPLTRFTIMKVGVEGIWREIFAFIRPTASSDRHLLLGLPWLHDVRAVIDIRASLISIGDFNLGETHTRIEGPKYDFLTSYKLTLAPVDPKYQNWVKEANAAAYIQEDIPTLASPPPLQPMDTATPSQTDSDNLEAETSSSSSEGSDSGDSVDSDDDDNTVHSEN